MKYLIITALYFLSWHASGQQNPEVLSLKEILSHIQTHSAHLSMYDAEAKSLDAAAKGAKSWAPPEFSTGFWMTPYSPKYWKGTSGMPGMGQYMISGQQSLPNKKRQNAEEKYLSVMSEVTRQQKAAKQNELFNEARKNYYQWMIAKKKINVLNEDMKILAFMIESAEIRYKNGTGKIGAYYKAKAALGNIANMRLMAENEINQKRINLNTLMHMPGNEPYDIDTLNELKFEEPVYFDTATILSNRNDIKALDKQISITILQQEWEKTKLKPEYGIRYDHMFGFGGLPMQFTLMGMVKIPFAKWSAKSYNANIQSLGYKANAQQQERETMINESIGMAYGLKAEIDTKQKQIKLFREEIIPALKHHYQTTLLAYQQNMEDMAMLFDSWEKLNSTQLDYYDIIQQFYSSSIELDKVLEISSLL